MTFFIVISRALKRLSFFWEIHKDSNKIFQVRAIIFFILIVFICVSIPIWYHKSYLPYKGYEYPQLSKMNVDSGIWVFSHDKNKLNYILTSDGRKILFEQDLSMSNYRRSLMKSQGLNTLSRFDPEIRVKAWWFPRPYVKANKLAQLETEGKMIITNKETYHYFLKARTYSSYFRFLKSILIIMLMLFIWEFIEQYNKYKEESE